MKLFELPLRRKLELSILKVFVARHGRSSSCSRGGGGRIRSSRPAWAIQQVCVKIDIPPKDNVDILKF